MTTPDRFPGVRQEEELRLETNASPGGGPGSISFDGFGFVLEDAEGTFDPRSGGGGITESQHRALRQLIHFINDGPADGFASGAYREITGTVFPSSIVWWESDAKLKKLVSLDVTWSGAFPTIEEWKVYDTDGSTVLITVTDTISYSGVFETSRVRGIV